MSGQDDVSTPSCSGPCEASPQLQLYQTIIFATPVLFAFLLLVLFCLLYVRRRRNVSTSTSQSTMQFVTRGFFPTSGSDHGLSKSFRQRLPTFAFDEKFAASSEDNQCVVCLGDYEPNEKLQQLPGCKHAFHVPCIDEWLAKNTTCPICRSSLLQEGSHNTAVSVRDGENRRESGDSRQWEERVINEVQEISVNVRPDASSAERNGMGTMASLESAPRFSIDIERS